MRPISLKIEAFGSYGKETLIDFTKPTQNLFLITGDTGSGKSTLFDAMVFALYGKGKVSDLEYQSNFAGFDKQPCVTFKFADSTAENAKQYTIIRTPQYSTYKKRGNKNELKNKSATITLIEDGSDNSWDSKNGAEDKIIDIVGLDRSQFMQVAMIAQGEFMTVIREKTENKKKIFRKIFNTGIYEKIADVFKNRKKDLENKTDIIKTECQTELLHTILYDKYDRCLDLEEQLELIKNGKMSAIDDFLIIFDEYCIYLEKEYENICNNNAEITKKYDDANSEQTKAEQLLNAFAEYDKAVEILAQCDIKKTEMTEKEDLLKKINDCYAINPYYKNYIKAQNEQNSLESKISIQEKELPDLEKKADIAESQVKETEPLFEKAKTDLAKVENSVKTALEIFAKKEEISKDLAKIKVEYTEKINLKTNKEKEIESINNLLKENNEIREKYKNAGVEKVQLDNEIKECKTLVEKNQNIEDIQNHIKELQQKCAEKQVEFKKYKEKYNIVNEEYERINNLFLSEQAGVLAKELKEGEPCKVCGSTVHPKPYTTSTENIDIPTQEAVNNAKKERDLIDKKLQEKAIECNDIIKDIANSEDNYNNLCEEICKSLDIPSKDLITAVLNEKKADLNTRYAENRANINALTKAENNISKLNEKLEKEIELLNTYDAEVKEYNEKVIKTEAALNEMINNSDFNSKEDAEKAKNKAEENKRLAENKYNLQRKEADKTKTMLAEAKITLDNNKTALPGYIDECKKAENEYKNILTEKKFDDNNYWLEYIEKYDENHTKALQAEVDKYNEEVKMAEIKKSTALNLIDGNEKPDTELLKEKTEELKKCKNKSDDEKINFFNLLETNKKVLNNVKDKVKNRTEILKKYKKVETIANAVSGEETGKIKMDLETFVQRYYLQNILHSANKRFTNMTGGQYKLVLKEEKDSGKQSKEGLDLMVYSLITGRVREIKTLSGGESFMAALSLALGMADQITSKKGSVNLDMMFIDEGFGSLDDRSRVQAVNVLTEMAGSDKLIGIISHVSELKQNIGNQLLVSKSENGSVVKWKLD